MPLHAEACALLYAIMIADQMGVSKVIIETDYLNLKYAMTSSDYAYSLLGKERCRGLVWIWPNFSLQST